MSVRIAARNFGPIERGSVTLGPLTIFIGPNNAGKSALAMLTYSAMNHFPMGRSRRSTVPARQRPLASNYLYWLRLQETDTLDVIRGHIRSLANQAAHLEPITVQSLSPQLKGYLSAQLKAVLQSYGEQICSELERSFGAKLQDLARINSGTAHAGTITISHQDPAWSVRILIRKNRPVIEVLKAPSAVRILRNILTEQPEAILRYLVGPNPDPDIMLFRILEGMADHCFKEFPSASYYLPAARSGILQSHKALASFVMSRAPLAGIEDMQIPKMTGVITDFITFLLNIGQRPKGDYKSVANYLEGSVLSGDVQIHGEPMAYPEISYRVRKTEFPLHRTSSMVSELAPVVLYLRYLVQQGDLLIIEEPESHLHPRSQVRLARAISRLVNDGLRVVLTTHSDYFLSQLNNLIVASSLEDSSKFEELSGAPIRSDEVLEAGQVKAYLFNYREAAGSTLIQSIPVKSEEGIAEDEFGRVAEALYMQSVDLDQSLVHEG